MTRLAALILALALLPALVTVGRGSAAPASLVAAYSFSEGSGSAVADSSGNANGGTTSATTWSTAGKYDKALSFNGTSSYVNVPDSASLDLTTGMTLEAWVRPSTSQGWRTVVLKQQSTDMVYGLYASNGATRPDGYIYTTAERNAAGTSTLPVNTWSHLAVSYDGSSIRLYVNGSLVTTTATTGNIVTSTGVLRIGGNSVWGEYFSGLIDEVRIYNRALAVAEIQADMNAPVSPSDTAPPSVPGDLSQTGATSDSVSLSWTASTDNTSVAGYGFYRDTTLLGSTTSTSATVSGLDCNTTYSFAVDAYDPTGNRSGKATVTGATGPCDTQAPTVPTNFVVTSVTGNSVGIAWDPASDNVAVTGYDLYQDGLTAGKTTLTTASFTGLSCSTLHTFGVAAYDARGNVSAVGTVSTTTGGCDTQPPTVGITAPAAGSTVSGAAVVLSANAGDDTAVLGVQFKVDGSNAGAEDTSAPYSITWNSTQVGNGPHSVTAVARDAAGNQATSAAVTVTVSNVFNPPGLVAAYGFEEASGSQTTDASTNANNGSIAGPARTAGKYGNGLRFDGVDDLVTVGDSNSLDLSGALTLEAWVNPRVVPTSWRNVVGKRSSSNWMYQLTAASSSSNRPANRVYAGGALRVLYGGSQLTAGTWVHLAATYDGSSQRLFVNGVQVSSRSQTGSVLTSSNSLTIGGSAAAGEYLDGMIDEIRIYNRALSQSELQTDMSSPVQPPAPDTTPPAVSGGSPSGTLSAGTTQATLQAATNESATCRYDTSAGVAYGSMAGAFTTTGGLAHSSTVTGLSDGGSYTYYLRCQDGSNNATTSDYVISFSVASPAPPDTQAPEVIVTAPVDGATVSGAGVALTAQASDNVAVAGVQFKVDGSNVGAEDTTAPYTVTWDSRQVANGSHAVTAVARDAAGNFGLATATTVTVDNDTAPPVVGLTAPSDGATVSGASVALSATATDNTAVAGVQFKVDGSNVGAEDTSPPYAISWSSSQVPNGAHSITAVARDTAGNSATSTPVSVTVANTLNTADALKRVTIGPGFVDASARQVVRTASDNVYVILADDTAQRSCNCGPGVLHAWKGNRAGIPTAFSEVDAAHRPTTTSTWILGSPDLRLDRNGVIHLVYINNANSSLVYRTFSTLTDTWGAPTTLATNARMLNDGGIMRTGNAALILDNADAPHVVYTTTTNTLVYLNKVSGSWSSPLTLSTGSTPVHPALATDASNVIHLAWADNSKLAAATIKYKQRAVDGSWSADETVDASALNNNTLDQGPSIALNSGGIPYVLYLNTSDYVRVKYRAGTATWTSNNPTPNLYAHTPQIYMQSNDLYAFLGHDYNIHPGWQYQLAGQAWSSYAVLDPLGTPDGSASTRWDPVRETNPGVIDYVYFDESAANNSSLIPEAYYMAVLPKGTGS